MKIFLLPFFLSHLFKKSSCSLMAKECTLTTSKMPPGGLPRNTMFRITDRPDMTSAVYRGRKALNQKNQKSTVSAEPRTVGMHNHAKYMAI